jgi:hypothetical protein
LITLTFVSSGVIAHCITANISQTSAIVLLGIELGKRVGMHLCGVK